MLSTIVLRSRSQAAAPVALPSRRSRVVLSASSAQTTTQQAKTEEEQFIEVSVST